MGRKDEGVGKQREVEGLYTSRKRLTRRGRAKPEGARTRLEVGKRAPFTRTQIIKKKKVDILPDRLC